MKENEEMKRKKKGKYKEKIMKNKMKILVPYGTKYKMNILVHMYQSDGLSFHLEKNVQFITLELRKAETYLGKFYWKCRSKRLHR